MAWGRGKGTNNDTGFSSGGGGGGGTDHSSSSYSGRNDAEASDPTAWIVTNEFANFVLMNTLEIKYMCMVGYTFLHGCKVFKTLGPEASTSYKCLNMILACTGGGIMVPIFLNTIPVTLAVDAYPLAIVVSFFLHSYFPVLREVVELSAIFKSLLIVFYETIRTYVVTLFVGLAATTIPASQFSFPIFGPIICGTIGGCGGAFLPFNKGLDPIKKDGLAPPMFSAFVGATFYHFFTHYANVVAAAVVTATDDATGTLPIPIIGPWMYKIVQELHIDAAKKGKIFVALWFILYAFYKNGIFLAVVSAPIPPPPLSSTTTTATKKVGAAAAKDASVPVLKHEKKTK